MSQEMQKRPDDFGGWLIRTAKQNPEGLLVLAAGGALLMRGAKGMGPRRSDPPLGEERGSERTKAEWTGALRDAASSVGEGAADVKNRAAEVFSSYASSASDYLQDTGRTVARQATHSAGRVQDALEQGFGEVLRQQPLAVAAAGLASGAFVAALFPRLNFEEETLRPAREAVYNAAAVAKDNLVQAAVETGQHVKESAAERGMSAEGLKDITRDAVDTLKSKIAAAPGETQTERRTPSGNTDPVPRAPQ